MQFKVPKGDIRWWSLLWLVCGLVMAVYGPIQGDTTFAILGTLLTIGCCLIWLDQKWIAPPLMILYGLGFLGRLLAMLSNGFTLAALAKLLMPLYFIYILWEWYRSQEEFVPTYRPHTPTSPFDTRRDDDHSWNPYQESRRDER